MANEIPASVRRLIAMKHQAILELELAVTELVTDLDAAQARVAELEGQLEQPPAAMPPGEEPVP